MRVAVLGAGSWGTVFSAVLADAGNEVALWSRRAEHVATLAATRESGYLEGPLPEAVTPTADAAAAVRGAEVVAVAVPAQAARATLGAFAGLLEPDAVVLSLVKGIELTTGERMSELLAAVLDVPATRVAVLSGPNLAREIAAHQPTATVIAAEDEALAKRLVPVCATAYFRPYTQTDVIGVELCGAIKNVIAIGIGIAQGRGYGDNTTATLITRGLAEMARLGVALGADAETFAGLAGMGDLFATCDSPLSRNHQLGRRIGEGASLADALAATSGTAEGVKTAVSVRDLARRVGVDMPITTAVAAVLHEGQPVDLMGQLLLARPHKADGV